MVNKYSMEELAKTFLIHANEAEKQRLKSLEEFPDAILPKEDFNIAMALHEMCKELARLKNGFP